MRRPPRKSNVPLFSGMLIRRSVMMGSINLAMTIAIYYTALKWLVETQARALCFATLVLGNIVLLLVSRTHGGSLSAVIVKRNRPFWIVTTIAVLALYAAIYVPDLASTFRFSTPPVSVMTSLALACLLSLAAIVLLSRTIRRQPVT